MWLKFTGAKIILKNDQKRYIYYARIYKKDGIYMEGLGPDYFKLGKIKIRPEQVQNMDKTWNESSISILTSSLLLFYQ